LLLGELQEYSPLLNLVAIPTAGSLPTTGGVYQLAVDPAVSL